MAANVKLHITWQHVAMLRVLDQSTHIDLGSHSKRQGCLCAPQSLANYSLQSHLLAKKYQWSVPSDCLQAMLGSDRLREHSCPALRRSTSHADHVHGIQLGRPTNAILCGEQSQPFFHNFNQNNQKISCTGSNATKHITPQLKTTQSTNRYVPGSTCGNMVNTPCPKQAT